MLNKDTVLQLLTAKVGKFLLYTPHWRRYRSYLNSDVKKYKYATIEIHGIEVEAIVEGTMLLNH